MEASVGQIYAQLVSLSEGTSGRYGRNPVFSQEHFWPEVLSILWEAPTCEYESRWQLQWRTDVVSRVWSNACHLLTSGELLLPGGGCAFRRSAVRHSHPGTMQAEREGHHQWFPHWPLPGQRHLLPGRRRVRAKLSLPGMRQKKKKEQERKKTQQNNEKKKKRLKFLFSMKHVISLSSSFT